MRREWRVREGEIDRLREKSITPGEEERRYPGVKMPNEKRRNRERKLKR
jgi:hypothetical protein